MLSGETTPEVQHVSSKHKLAAGAAAIVTAAGTGGAIAATEQRPRPRQKFLVDAAARLHVSEPQLASRRSQGAYLDRLNAASQRAS